MQPIGEVLKKILKEMGMGDLYYEGLLRVKWKEIVGSEWDEIAHLVRFQDGKVWVRVPAPVFLYEIQAKEGEILKRIHKAHPALHYVKKLVFCVG
ncbi:MAG: DUF721 domain-containing protein [bacterium JZ-2024 1]